MWKRVKLIREIIKTYEYNPRYSRLAGDIAAFEPQLRKRISEAKNEDQYWIKPAETLLNQAKVFLEDYKIDEGWKSLHTSQRYEIFAMDKHERLACAKALVNEAEKLNEWRKDAIISLLCTKKDELAEAPSAEVLFQAAKLKDENYNNQYYMNRLSRNLFWLLSVLLFVVLTSIVAYFLTCIPSFGDDLAKDLNPVEYLVGVILFGTLGAITSAILFTRNLSHSSRIKEISSSQVMVFSKIFIGAGFSVFIFLLLHSSITDGIKLFAFSISKPLDYFAIAFASGFTERLAQKSMGLIIGNKQVKKPNTSVSDIAE
jgi:hypothetical protein